MSDVCTIFKDGFNNKAILDSYRRPLCKNTNGYSLQRCKPELIKAFCIFAARIDVSDSILHMP